MILITKHAFDRYRERIADLSDAAIIAALDTPAMQTAVQFGARAVILGTGHRAVLRDGVIVTITPRGNGARVQGGVSKEVASG